MKRYSIWLDLAMLGKLDKAAKGKGVKKAQLIRLYISAGLKKDKA